MKNRILVFIVFIMISKINYSQVEVGLKFDLNGNPINGFFDPLIYSPKKRLIIINYSSSFEKGYFYDSLDNKVQGQIKLNKKRILFKNDIDSRKRKIEPEEIKSFVIGIDSFFVVKNFYYKNKLIQKPEFVQYITEINGNIFAKYYGKYFMTLDKQTITYLVKPKESETWENFTDDLKFKEKALKYFHHIPYLKEKISSKKYLRKDIMSIIKMAEYYQKYQNNHFIYFNKYLQELRNANKAIYFAKITKKTDSIWTFSYIKDRKKMYQANYSSFYPNTKNGQFIAYHLNGVKRQVLEFENNKIKSVKIYDKFNKLTLGYDYVETKGSLKRGLKNKIVYNSLIDSNSNNLFESTNEFNQEIFDDFANEYYFKRFRNKELVSSTRLRKNDTVFQIVDIDYNFKITKLQYKLANFVSNEEYKKKINTNAQGIIVVNFTINPDGYIIHYSILNSIHPELDKIIKDFIESIIATNTETPFKFKPFKINKKKRYFEVTIPFEFSKKEVYRAPVLYNHFNDLFFWQQQNLLNNIPLPTITN